MQKTIKNLFLPIIVFVTCTLGAQTDSTYSDSIAITVPDTVIYPENAEIPIQNIAENQENNSNSKSSNNWWGNGLRIVNFQSTKVLEKGQLDFCIQHRFGYLSQGKSNFFGLDESNYRLGFDYGLINHLTIGVGRSNVGKILNGYFKWEIVKQNETVPFSVSLLEDLGVSLAHPPSGLEPYYWTHRLKYTSQLIIAHVFGDSRFMIQIAPTVVHRNFTDSATEPNDLLSLTSDLRFRITKGISITGEYGFLFPRDYRNQLRTAAGAGVEFYTARHVFQLLVSNAYYMNEANILTMQNGNISKGEIRFGFNVVRSF
ncbi:MAG: hypothetical protein KG003_15810 [Bacteroidetes bacterium]|nr:hypothetical protein [Bacteroidota bacterium]